MEAEERMTNIINSFKIKLASVAENAISEVYSEILPHVENDTFMNVQYRSQRVIENMIAGKFTVVDDNTVRINDDNDMCVDIKVTDTQWDNLRRSLLTVMPACPKDLEIASLKEQLKFAENNAF
ncbi:MAG TPA: hypothetical protein EYN67_06940 [Flavobacteriales bacterium]|nr:hypothetical protein [Methylococcaceae bacterium]HHZ95281.1 hypothetical protein [Flavobacteriales bacterium]